MKKFIFTYILVIMSFFAAAQKDTVSIESSFNNISKKVDFLKKEVLEMPPSLACLISLKKYRKNEILKSRKR